MFKRIVRNQIVAMVKNLSVYCNKKYGIDKKSIHSLIKELKTILNFEIRIFEINFITSEDIININTQYLGHKNSTDIITFNYSGENNNFDGEIYISLEDALENSKKFKVSFDNEIIRLVIHGVLHMLGYDDIKATDKKKMKVLENSLVARFKNKFSKVVIK